MSTRVLSLALSLLLICFGNGCALTGATSTFEVALEAPANAPPMRLGSVTYEPSESRLANVGTFDWGKYGEEDLSTLGASLEQSLKPLEPEPGLASHEVHVRVRRFLVAHSNNEALAFACVSWALTDPDGELAFVEQFYARDHVVLWGTVGGTKDTVHEGIATRVLRSAVRVAAAGEPVPPFHAENTFGRFEAAMVGMPESLTSVHVGGLYLGGAFYVFSSRYSGDSQVSWVKAHDHFDWSGHLQRRRLGRTPHS